jgi:hypothetical protein
MKTKTPNRSGIQFGKGASWSIATGNKQASPQSRYVLIAMQILDKPEPIQRPR